MQTFSARAWGDFEEYVRRLVEYNKESYYSLLFRGHQDACWSLESTLERANRTKYLVEEYYASILRCKPEIEMLTDLSWEIDGIAKIHNLLKEYDAFRRMLDGHNDGRVLGDSYMAYLRHHGFPSPLLGWSKSHYIAA